MEIIINQNRIMATVHRTHDPKVGGSIPLSGITHKVNLRNYPGKLFQPSNSLLYETHGDCDFWNRYITSFNAGFSPCGIKLPNRCKKRPQSFKVRERGILV